MPVISDESMRCPSAMTVADGGGVLVTGYLDRISKTARTSDSE
jgi:hypothetical protein